MTQWRISSIREGGGFQNSGERIIGVAGPYLSHPEGFYNKASSLLRVTLLQDVDDMANGTRRIMSKLGNPSTSHADALNPNVSPKPINQNAC